METLIEGSQAVFLLVTLPIMVFGCVTFGDEVVVDAKTIKHSASW